MGNHRSQDGLETAGISSPIKGGAASNDEGNCVAALHETSLILRRPILDAAETLVGYEFKPASLSGELPSDAQMSGFVGQLAALLGNVEISRIADQKLIMLAVQGELLQQKVLDQLSCESLILSVSLPPVVPPQLVGFLKEAWSRGFCIALDNYADTPDQEYLLHAVSYVRIDVSRFNALEIARRAADLLEKSGVRLIASNVRSRDDFEACSKLPFDYYEGDFFTERPVRPGVRLDRDRIQVIALLNQVREKADLITIERGFRQDPTLVYQLLRYINAPGVGLSREINSIVQALTVLGYDQLYRWLTLLLFSGGHSAPRDRALLQVALVRGRLTELLGSLGVNGAERGGLFIAGVFSMLDALLGIPLREALSQIRLSPAVGAVLLEQSGVYAPYLQLTVACESGNQARIENLLEECCLSAEAVNRAHVEALLWAESLI